MARPGAAELAATSSHASDGLPRITQSQPFSCGCATLAVALALPTVAQGFAVICAALPALVLARPGDTALAQLADPQQSDVVRVL